MGKNVILLACLAFSCQGRRVNMDLAPQAFLGASRVPSSVQSHRKSSPMASGPTGFGIAVPERIRLGLAGSGPEVQHIQLGCKLLEAGRVRASLRHFEIAWKLSPWRQVESDSPELPIFIGKAAIILCNKYYAKSSILCDVKLAEARLLVLRCLARWPFETDWADLLFAMETIKRADSKEITTLRSAVDEMSDLLLETHGDAIEHSWNETDIPKAGETLVIAFAGLNCPTRDGIPSQEFRGACRRAGLRAIFVRDVLRAWFTRGIRGGERSFDGMVRILQDKINVLQPGKVIVVGASMGGYAAVRAGIALNADLVLAFAPQVFIDLTYRQNVGLPFRTFIMLLKTLKPMSYYTGIPLTSLVDAVEMAPNECRTNIQLHLGTLDDGDVQEAAALKAGFSSGKPSSSTMSLKIIEHPKGDHNFVIDMRDTGELHELLLSAAGTGPLKKFGGVGFNKAGPTKSKAKTKSKKRKR